VLQGPRGPKDSRALALICAQGFMQLCSNTAPCEYPGYEAGQGWTMKPGNLEGDSGGDDKGIWGALLISHPEIPPQYFQVSLSPPGLSHTLDMHTQPTIQGLNRPGVDIKDLNKA